MNYMYNVCIYVWMDGLQFTTVIRIISTRKADAEEEQVYWSYRT